MDFMFGVLTRLVAAGRLAVIGAAGFYVSGVDGFALLRRGALRRFCMRALWLGCGNKKFKHSWDKHFDEVPHESKKGQ